jgi:hypothetical protein
MANSSRHLSRHDLTLFVKAVGGPPPPVLYHYTSAESLKRILETRRLLATHHEFTNDPTELRYGHRLVVEETKRTLAQLSTEANWAAPILTKVIERIEREGFHDDMPTFVACFSADGDSLGQWRAYAQDGRGYAIGFDTGEWEYDKSNGDIGTILVECVYDQKEMAETVAYQHRTILEQGGKLLQVARDGASRDGIHLAFEKAIFLSGAIATLRLKDRGFLEEKEWRLAALPDTPANGRADGHYVRELGGVFAPAIALRLSHEGQRLPLRHIVIGPCHAQEGRIKSAQYGVRELLRLMENDVVSPDFVTSSRIPYRSHARAR